MNELNEFFRAFGRLFGVIGEDQSPRQNLLQGVYSEIVTPTSLNLITQQYFDILSKYVWIGILCLLPFEVLTRVWNGFRSDPGYEAKEIGKSILVTFALVGFIPFLVVGVRSGWSFVGSMNAGFSIADATPDKVIAQVEVLTGNRGIDLLLVIAQVFVLLLLKIATYVVMGMIWVAPIILYLTYSARWIPGLGEALRRFGFVFTAWATSLMGIFYLITGMGINLGTALFGGNPADKAYTNTAAMIVCLLVFRGALRTLRANVAMVTSSYKEFTQASSSGGGRFRAAGRDLASHMSTARRNRRDFKTGRTGEDALPDENQPGQRDEGDPGISGRLRSDGSNQLSPSKLADNDRPSSTARRSRPRVNTNPGSNTPPKGSHEPPSDGSVPPKSELGSDEGMRFSQTSGKQIIRRSSPGRPSQGREKSA